MRSKQKLYFDIETVRSTKPPEASEIKVPANYTKQETIDKYIAENLEAEWNKTALNSLKGRILCIGYAIDDGDVEIITGSEREIIGKFEEVVMENPFLDWIGHNISHFDLPFIYHRAIKYNKKSLRNVMPKQRFDKSVFDTMIMFSGTDYTAKHSLKSICDYLGIANIKGEIDGSMVGEYYLQGKLQEIYDYCKQDVSILREVFNKINN